MKILLKNGLIYDGSLEKPKIGDIYLDNGKIKTIGNNLNMTVDEVIDCTNLIVSPGFIDSHSHNDFYVGSKDAILPFLKQGITTQIVGNCGFSAYGVSPDSQYKELVGGSLFKTTNAGSLNAYANRYRDKLIQNIVPLVGHGTTRISVNGMSSSPLTTEQFQEQLRLLEDNLQQGAFGGSIGLMYEPGMYAPFEELVEIAKVIKKYNGILTVHPRANSKIALGYPLLSIKPHIEQGLDEVIKIMKATGVRVEYSHLIFVGKSSWKSVNPMLKKFKNAREEGYEIAYDIYPFTYGASTINVILPGWYLQLSPEERKKKATLFKLKTIINITKKLLGIDFTDLIITYIGPDYPQYEGRTVADIANDEGLKPIDMYIKLVDLSKGEGKIMLDKYYNEEIIEKLMKDDLSVYMTDAWYEEQGAQNAGTFQAYPFFLQKTKKFNIPLENTIHKMTGKITDRFQIKNRGYIKEDYAADITIFDYNDININFNDASSTPTGIKYVLINGEVVLDNNQYNGKTNGKLLRFR